MKKRVFIIHGWSGYPGECWFPWLKKELLSRGFEVFVPNMPDAENPSINAWVSFLKKQVGKPDQNTYFVGHSIGCQAIMRYLQGIDSRIGGAVFVAAWFDLENLETKEEERIAKPWIENPIDLAKVKANAKEIFSILSDNDPFGALRKNKENLAKLGKVIIQKHKGHFSNDEKMIMLPIALKELLRIAE